MNLLRRLKEKGKARQQTGDNVPLIDTVRGWLSALAHEIRNPLNTMRLNLQLLQEDYNQPDDAAPAPDSNNLGNNQGSKALKRLEILSKEVNRLEEVLNEFLRFARLPQPNLQPSNVYSLLDEFLDFIEPEAQQSNIKVVRDFGDDLPEVDLDSSQIKQALLNIILNANQAMPTGGQLTIKAYRSVPARKCRDHISIDVIDTGEGISPDRIDKMFDLFYSTKKAGTGLGLPIANRIINMHGGEIQVKSQEGKGTTVSILLPIHQNKSLRV